MIYSEYKTYSFDYLLLLPRTHWKPFLKRSTDSFLAAEIFSHHSSFCQRRQNDCSQCSLTVCLISRANIRTSFTSQSRSRGSSAQSWTTSSGTRAPTPDRSGTWPVTTTTTTTTSSIISTITRMLQRRMWFLVNMKQRPSQVLLDTCPTCPTWPACGGTSATCLSSWRQLSCWTRRWWGARLNSIFNLTYWNQIIAPRVKYSIESVENENTFIAVWQSARAVAARRYPRVHSSGKHCWPGKLLGFKNTWPWPIHAFLITYTLYLLLQTNFYSVSVFTFNDSKIFKIMHCTVPSSRNAPGDHMDTVNPIISEDFSFTDVEKEC